MTLLEAHIEEFETGTWVADLIADQTFGPRGQFRLPDGSTWIGTRVSEVQDRGRFFSKVVGGNGSLGAVVLDQFYQGQVALSAVVASVCSPGPSPGDQGETPSNVQAGVFLGQYMRQVGTRGEALDDIAKAAGGAVSPGSAPMLWWIGRDGTLQMQAPDTLSEARPTQAPVTGTQNMDKVDVDASVELVTPSGAVLGATYGVGAQVVRHLRWKYTPQSFSARLFFVPFIFRAPTQTKYDRTYDAKIVADHGDGTVDVIAYRSPSEGKAPAFQVANVQLFCGVPGAKAKMNAGEEVTLGFFSGDPQKPFAMSMKQDATVSPTKKVARNGDQLTVTLAAADITALAAMFKVGPGVAVGSTVVATPVDLPLSGTCQINGGSARLLVGDA
jgi:hypothetical protein